MHTHVHSIGRMGGGAFTPAVASCVTRRAWTGLAIEEPGFASNGAVVVTFPAVAIPGVHIPFNFFTFFSHSVDSKNTIF